MKKLVDPYFDGEKLFTMYFGVRGGESITTLAKLAVSSGMTSVEYKNKNKIPRMGVWKAMWRWASLKENRDRAFQIFCDYLDKYGWTWDDEYDWDTDREALWKKFMLQKIKSAWQFEKARHDRFLKENGWL